MSHSNPDLETKITCKISMDHHIWWVNPGEKTVMICLDYGKTSIQIKFTYWKSCKVSWCFFEALSMVEKAAEHVKVF